MHHLFASIDIAPTTLAYIDGGMGSMLLQGAIAGLLTGAYLLKARWSILRAKLATVLPKADRSGR